MNPFYDELELELISAFLAEGVAFVVIGGAAVQFHGYERVREDIDYFVRPTTENIDAVDRALANLQAPRRLVRKDRDGMVLRKKSIRLSGPNGLQDILSSVAGIEFEEALAEAEMCLTDIGPVPVLSLRHLLAAKRATPGSEGRAHDQKDIDDIAHLTRINGHANLAT